MSIPFEGPEKKLEIILKTPLRELRSNADGRWTEVVHSCGAKIVSSTSLSSLDAYLLSESSLFLWDDRILIITCGTTSLIDAVQPIVNLVSRENIAFFFYERKNLMYPHLQRSDFEMDARDLAAQFTGKSYRLGPANDDHIHIFYHSTPGREVENDITLEILMHDLHPEVLEAFMPRQDEPVEAMERRTGIATLYPAMLKDSYQFEPYGYSLNKIADDTYLTVHVTPEPGGSYASFETNVHEEDYSGTINRVVEIFRPRRFSLVVTGSQDEHQTPQEELLPRRVGGYHRTENSFYEFDSGYAVSFRNYVKAEH